MQGYIFKKNYLKLKNKNKTMTNQTLTMQYLRIVHIFHREGGGIKRKYTPLQSTVGWGGTGFRFVR